MLAEAMQSSIPILHMSTQVSRLCGRMGSLRPGPEVAVVTAGLETPRSIDFNERFLGLDGDVSEPAVGDPSIGMLSEHRMHTSVTDPEQSRLRGWRFALFNAA